MTADEVRTCVAIGLAVKDEHGLADAFRRGESCRLGFVVASREPGIELGLTFPIEGDLPEFARGALEAAPNAIVALGSPAVEINSSACTKALSPSTSARWRRRVSVRAWRSMSPEGAKADLSLVPAVAGTMETEPCGPTMSFTK